MNNELKPCPFCGASYDKDEDDFVYAADHENWCPLRGMAYGGYGLTVGDTEEEIDAWNTRYERTCKPETEVADTVDIGIGFLEKLVDNCSECGEPLTVEYSINAMWRRVLPNYCPNCGAKVVE